MSRKTSHTLILAGELVARTPLHLGGADSGDTIDMPLAVDGQGRYYLPGTSLAGALRASGWEQGGDDAWGHATGDKGHASRYLIDDAPALDSPQAELWHGVGIDRYHGGAREHVKFDRQILPRGTRFTFRLQREIADEADLAAARADLGSLAHALQQGEIAFGGGQTRGQGRLWLDKAQGREIAWSSRAGILAWLGDAPSGDALPGWLKQKGSEPAGRLGLEIHWHPLGPLMSKAAQDGVIVDSLPFVSRVDADRLALALPGSGIKGALRQHAERIVRTVLGSEEGMDARQHFDQIDVPLVRQLFGGARPADKEAKKRADREADKEAGKETAGTANPPGGRGRLAVDTCYSTRTLSEAEWRALDTDPATWKKPDGFLRKADHVAIDRWTGGAADGLLFNTAEPDAQLAWEPIRLHLDRQPDDSTPQLALLWLLLRDLAAGRIPLGFGVNRGYGDLAVDRIVLRGLESAETRDGANSVELAVTAGQIDETPVAPLIDNLKSAWLAWQAQTAEEHS